MLIGISELLVKPEHMSIPQKGIVTDNADPLQIGRVQCTVEGLLEETDPLKQPWIAPVNSTGFGGGVSISGFRVPDIGSELLIISPFNDIYALFYNGYWQSATTHQTLFDTNYPNSYGGLDASGNSIRIDKTAQSVDIVHSSGTTFSINAAGDITISNPGNTVWTTQGAFTHNITGVMTINSASSVNNSDLQVNGDVTNTGNIVADADISDVGGAKGTIDGNLRGTFNNHVHPENGGAGPTSTPTTTM